MASFTPYTGFRPTEIITDTTCHEVDQQHGLEAAPDCGPNSSTNFTLSATGSTITFLWLFYIVVEGWYYMQRNVALGIFFIWLKHFVPIFHYLLRIMLTGLLLDSCDSNCVLMRGGLLCHAWRSAHPHFEKIWRQAHKPLRRRANLWESTYNGSCRNFFRFVDENSARMTQKHLLVTADVSSAPSST